MSVKERLLGAEASGLTTQGRERAERGERRGRGRGEEANKKQGRRERTRESKKKAICLKTWHEKNAKKRAEREANERRAAKASSGSSSKHEYAIERGEASRWWKRERRYEVGRDGSRNERRGSGWAEGQEGRGGGVAFIRPRLAARWPVLPGLSLAVPRS